MKEYRQLIRGLFRWTEYHLFKQGWKEALALLRRKNTQKGKKAIIICNGPSLNDLDWSLMTGMATFGLNKVSLLCESFGIAPDFSVIVNPRVLLQEKDKFDLLNKFSSLF